MKRKLIAGERIMYVDAFTAVNGVFTVKISGSLTVKRLGAALSKVQAKHPLLRACIIEDGSQNPWFVLKDTVREIPIRIVQRSSDHTWIRESKSEWKKLFDIKAGPLARLVWIKSEEGDLSELILVCAHCISDGTSLVNLMQELLMLADEPGKEIGINQPVDPIMDLVPGPLLADWKKVLKARVISVLSKAYLSVIPCRLPLQERNDYLIRWKLDKEVSTAIFDRCRAESISVHAVLSAAFLSAFRQVRGKKAHNKLICPVDIRRYVTQLKNDTMFAFAPVIRLSLFNDPEADFWVNARKVKNDLSVRISRLRARELLMLGEYFHSSVKRMTKYLRSTKGSHDFTFSNIGRVMIHNNYRSFCIEDVYTPTIAFPWRNSTTIVASTFRGQMDFAFISNDPFLALRDAENIKDKAMTLLLEEILDTNCKKK